MYFLAYLEIRKANLRIRNTESDMSLAAYALPRLGSNDWRAAVLLVPRRLSFRKAPCGSPCEEVCASPSLGV